MQDAIKIRGARVHNLKNVDVTIPRHSLTVFTGVSGSGKSSLAFDTIYAEGQRRFMESLSSFSRQFMEGMDKPDVDSIEGLPPAIAIDQRTTISSPRSTVGTATELYDYFRILFAAIGTPHCTRCSLELHASSRQKIIEAVIAAKKNHTGELFLLSPLDSDHGIDVDRIVDELHRSGYHSIRFDKKVMTLREFGALRFSRADTGHTLEIIVDRLESSRSREPDIRRIAESIQTALELGDGTLIVEAGGMEMALSERLRCPSCGFEMKDLDASVFSFNNPRGACPTCTGLGYLLAFDPELLMPNPRLTIAQGAIQPLHKLFSNNTEWLSLLEGWAAHARFSIDAAVETLTSQQRATLLHGVHANTSRAQAMSAKRSHGPAAQPFEGVVPYLEKKYRETGSEYLQKELEAYMRTSLCRDCAGKRLRPELLCVTVGGHSINEFVTLSIDALASLIASLTDNAKKAHALSSKDREISKRIIKEILSRLEGLHSVGLGYLTLDRSMPTLSGGEAQRVKLATHVRSSLVGVVYVLDEPSVGLHPRDTQDLLRTLRELKEQGNTVLIVEHEKQIILNADLIVDVGPRAGRDGGAIVGVGTPKEIMKEKRSLTGAYLSGARSLTPCKKPRAGNGLALRIRGARAFNLKNITIAIPLGRLVCVTGVSGSGKSTLIVDILSKAIMKKLYRSKDEPEEHDAIEGIEHIDKTVVIDQSPIGRTPRSNPATYTNLFTPIRELFTALPEAKIKGFKPGHFSFNVKGGRCESCQGEGMTRIDMRFLSDVFVECRDCSGKRYNSEALEIHYDGLTIADVLDLTVDEAKTFFVKTPSIAEKLQTLSDVGLGYMKLGQPATTLSGGEAQRIKLAGELARRQTGKTLYILDEPTIGLHPEDIKQLLIILNQLVDKGNTIVIIEHNTDIIRNSDWVIDLGPEGGDKGGQIVAEGTPDEIASHPNSWTGRYLQEEAKRS
ncbi:excinuclease ABC subunit UvrA [Candidatus Uhrbacteria bacterium]|nr:excinuclease ABC subunit UvrA [Candidatus Uhrbacteria bacterium]